MKARLVCLVLASSLTFSMCLAQSGGRSDRRMSHPSRSTASDFGLFPGVGMRSHVGIFPVSRTPREFGGGLSIGRFIWSGHRPTQAGRGPFDFDPYDMWAGYYGGSYPFYYSNYGPTPTLYDSRNFVEQWKSRDPDKPAENQISESVMLEEGMSEEAVVRAVGTPLQKVKLGERTVWRYSGYSLMFEGGTLKEIR